MLDAERGHSRSVASASRMLVNARCHRTRRSAEEHALEALPKPVVDKLVREYQTFTRDNPKMAVATVAIKTLTSLIMQSEATTMMGLEKEVKEAAAALQRCVHTPHTPSRHRMPQSSVARHPRCAHVALRCGCRTRGSALRLLPQEMRLVEEKHNLLK